MQVKRLGYIAMDVADLDSSVRFYQDVAHLNVSERRDKLVFLTGGREHHWLILRQSNHSRFQRVAFEMNSEAELDAMAERLEQAGTKVTAGDDLANERVARYVRFTDPDGLMVELFTGMVELPGEPLYVHNIRLEKMLHAVFRVTDISRSYKFYHDLLGFKASDWVEHHAVFLRCADLYHHSLALFGGAREAAFDHLCILVPTLDDLMRARANVIALGVPLRNDLLRHGPSGSIAFYLQDEPNRMTTEFCIEHGRILDHAHRPRILPAIPETLDVWTPLGTGIRGAFKAPTRISPQSVPSYQEVLGIESLSEREV